MRSKLGKIVNDPNLPPGVQTELNEVHEELAKRISKENIDTRSISEAIALELRDGELGVLNNVLEGKTPFRKLVSTDSHTQNDWAVFIETTGINQNGVNIENHDGASGNSGTALNIHVDSDDNNSPAIFLTQDGTGFIIQTDTAGHLTAGGDWIDASSKHTKENFEPVSESWLLQQVDRLELYKYNKIKEPEKLKRYGPMAEDWYELFGLGDAQSISGKDVASVAISCVRELLKRVEALETKVEELQNAR